jgi:hypothetical protein
MAGVGRNEADTWCGGQSMSRHYSYTRTVSRRRFAQAVGWYRYHRDRPTCHIKEFHAVTRTIGTWEPVLFDDGSHVARMQPFFRHVRG